MKKLVLLAFLFMLVGCAANEPTYVDQLSQRPYPQTEEGVRSECSWIRSEIARMQSLMAYSATSQYAMYFQAMGRNNIAALESRAANLRCSSAFSSTHIIEKPIPAPDKQSTTSTIVECIEACKKYTSSTDEECFDKCNK